MSWHATLTKAVRLRTRLYWSSRWANGDYVSSAPAIIVGGSERSGTTLLRTMLDSHPNITAGPESWLFVYRVDFEALALNYGFLVEEVEAMRRESRCLAHFIELFFAEYARRMEKKRWAEKSPANVTRLDFIWRHFPKARFVHVIRDGRDVVCSLRSQRERLRREGHRTGDGGTVDQRLALWKRHVEAGLAWRGDSRYLELRYEDLVASPRKVMERVLNFLDEPWSDDVLHAREYQLNRPHKIMEHGTPEVHKPIFRNSIGRWRHDLTRAESERCWEKVGKLLQLLGYER